LEVNTETRYLNEKSLASYIDTSQHTLKYWRKIGQGPKFITLPNGRIRYRKEDVEEYMRGIFGTETKKDD
tara:strand:- start:46 stop:255 length:210 start_codon:yes stop_codon:yes gene_type:complete